MSKKKPVFIVGCSRSGTTLLHACLASSSEIFTFPETQLPFSFFGSSEQLMFGRKRPSMQPLNELRNRLLEMLQDHGICRNNYVYQIKRMRQKELSSPLLASPVRKFMMRDAFSLYRSAIEEVCTPGTWLEKSPRNIFIVKYIEKYIPDAKFIHVVRPGEETVASLVDAGRRYKAFYDRFGRDDGISRAVLYWNEAVRHTTQVKGSTKHFIVAYQNLVADPKSQLERICSFIGVSYSKSMTNPDFASVANRSETWKFKHGNQIGRSSSKYDALFSNEEKQYISSKIVMKRQQVRELAHS